MGARNFRIGMDSSAYRRVRQFPGQQVGWALNRELGYVNISALFVYYKKYLEYQH